ncbi:MAG: ATP-binding cassette domain-containing protein [Bdellovibrionota bacterium]
MENAVVPVVEARGLRFSYRPGEEILKGVSFKIHPGELVAVTGPSGSGKSTLFYLLGCLLDRFEGDVLVKGRSTRDLSQNEKAWLRNREIGFVFQQFYLLPRATVLENILLPTQFPFDDSRATPEDRARAAQIAEKLGITDLLDRSPQELSGGQQQRVAIARALLRKADLILADEPTGNLDSKSSESVMEILKKLNQEGHTIVVVTHDSEIAEQCTRVIRVKDGLLESDETSDPSAAKKNAKPFQLERHDFGGLGLGSFVKAMPVAWGNIKRSRAKSALTMLGVSLGVAAVLTTMSLGAYAKNKILEGYEAMGVNTLRFYGYPNWRRSSQDFAPATFKEFKWDSDLVPLMRTFPQIEAVSPLFNMYEPTLSFGGLSFADKTMALGVNEQYFPITGQRVSDGRALSVFDVKLGAAVCVIGAEVKNRLFTGALAVGRTLSVSQESANSMPCKIVGVLEKQPSSQDQIQIDNEVIMPYTYFSKMATMPYQRSMQEFLMKIQSGYDPAEEGPSFEGYFISRYGSTGQFAANSDAKLISQMKLFLNVFSGLLSAVAVIALVVGGVGINNMMLASLSERLKELGLRKALGATPRQLRFLMLGESVLLCTAAGLVGLVVGFGAYQGLVFAATKLIPKLQYEWIFEPTAFILSFAAIFLTGLSSGFVPAMKAERLDVMDALRQDI